MRIVVPLLLAISVTSVVGQSRAADHYKLGNEQEKAGNTTGARDSYAKAIEAGSTSI